MVIHVHETQLAMALKGRLQNAYGGLSIACGREEQVDSLSLLIDRSVIVCPLAVHFDIGFIHSPTTTDVRLLSPEGCVQLWGIMNDPPIDGPVIDGEPPFGYPCFTVSIPERVGQIPPYTLEDHILLNMPALEGYCGHGSLS